MRAAGRDAKLRLRDARPVRLQALPRGFQGMFGSGERNDLPFDERKHRQLRDQSVQLLRRIDIEDAAASLAARQGAARDNLALLLILEDGFPFLHGEFKHLLGRKMKSSLLFAFDEELHALLLSAGLRTTVRPDNKPLHRQPVRAAAEPTCGRS